MLSRRHLANAIRALSMDAVQKANSGHPGMPMGMADIAEVLWNDFLCHNPVDPKWVNRDRFVVSNGHGSMLLYSLLHLSGYDLSIDELRNFRQLHSKTPGHPEYGMTPGIETTTGPLGQGLANAVGMAMGEKHMASQFNRSGHEIIDHYTYVFCGDGCLMEGISHEACSLAGTQKLGKLILFWDDNSISIDGKVEGWFTDDTPKRFESYGWQVIRDVDGHDSASIKQAISDAREDHDKPTLICCKTVIGFGAPNAAGSHTCHGAPLGDEEIAKAKTQLDWHHGPFELPTDVMDGWNARTQGEQAQVQWEVGFAAYQTAHPELALEFQRRTSQGLPEGWQQHAESYIRQCHENGSDMATRKASQHCLNAYASQLPEMVGGSADLTGSNLTNWKGSEAMTGDHPGGNYLHYGVREFAMSAVMNGLALYGSFIPYGGTFLVFADYARNAVRMAALMQQQVVFVYSHDSIGLGEDGPTHQAIEHAAMLRLTPNMSVWRPADDVETAVAWRCAIERRQGPTSLLLSRQTLPHLTRNEQQLQAVERGGYTIFEGDGKPDLIFIATGSEVHLAVDAARVLAKDGYCIRVVSMPCTDTFDSQEAEYRESILPAHVTKRISVEAGAKDYWYKYVGLEGKIIGMDRFGESAPGNELFTFFGFTTENLVKEALLLLGGNAQ